MPDWVKVDEYQLLRLAQNGNVNAYGELYNRHVEVVYRFLYAHLSYHQDAEDLTEEVFLRAWQALPRYRFRGIPFNAFLMRIARNALTDHYRRHSRVFAEKDIDDIQYSDPAIKPDEEIGQRMEHQEVITLLQELRKDYRSVLILRFINHLSPQETALIMGRSPGAVRVLQHRALNALRKLLEK